MDLDYDVIKFCFWKSENDLIDPFEEKILIPLITYTENYKFSETMVLGLSNKTTYNGNRYIIPKMKLGFATIDGVLMTTSEMYI